MTPGQVSPREVLEYCRTRPHLLRRQGPNFLQLEPTPDIWLHFWGDARATTPDYIAAQAHTHHRDFSSTVYLGSLVNSILKFEDDEHGAYEQYLLKGGDAMSASECVPCNRRMSIARASHTKYSAGEMYDMVADTWHRTAFSEPSITMLHLKSEVVPRYIAFTAGLSRDEASLKWVKVDWKEALYRIDGLMEKAGL